ncbi:MAG: CDP-glycerol glycerophosphotransferase family protein [Micropruina sp.]|uniref:CDP-glycerol glycerophosphotransferase family protein n=1 Tax=Micropruina sp. TaxID=2737536 RepID=UPI0039E50C52
MTGNDETKPKVSRQGAAQRIWLGGSTEFAVAVLGADATTGRVGEWRARIGALYLPIIGGGVAVMVVALLAGWSWLGLIAYLAMTVADWVATSALARRTVLLHRMRADSATRNLLYGAAMAAVVARDGLEVPASVQLVVLLSSYFADLLHRVAARSLARRQPPMLFVPGGRQTPEAIRYARIYLNAHRVPIPLLVIQLVVAALVVVAPRMDGGWWVWVAVAGVVLGLGWAVVESVVVRRLGAEQNTERSVAELMEFLDRWNPTHIVYMSAGPGQAKYILNQWLGTFDRVPANGIVVVRESSHLGQIQPTRLPVVYAPKTRHVEELTRPTVRIAYYLANAGRNVHLLREASVRHVFLNHGDSDKSTSANPVARVYDRLWVAGAAAIERYEAAGIDIPRDRYAIVGRPQVDALAVGPRTGGGRFTVLYAPTFEGYYEESNYSSLETMGPTLIRRILADYPDVRILFKPHPNSGVQRPGMIAARVEIADMLAAAGGDHVFVDPASPMTLYDAFDQADALVSDISSVVTDFLYTERPIVITNPRRMAPTDFVETFPTQATSYLLDADFTQFSTIMADILGADSFRTARLEMKRYVLGDLPDGPLAAFIAEGERLAIESAHHAAGIRNQFRVKTSRDDSLNESELSQDD